jgi:hypothetical protein
MSQFSSFGAGLVSLVSYVVVFLIFVRVFSSAHWFTLQVVLGGIVHLLCTAFFFVYWPDFRYWHSLGVFAVGWFLFFTFSTAIYVSISARILRQLFASRNQTMSVEEIFNSCIRPPFEMRAKFLVKNGLAEMKDGKFLITKKGHENAERISNLRRFFDMDTGGLYAPKSER